MANPTLRRGLPRMSGGEPWPPSTLVAAHQGAARHSLPTATSVTDNASVETGSRDWGKDELPIREELSQRSQSTEPPAWLRRGLPRLMDGEPWPPLSLVGASRPVPREPEGQATINEIAPPFKDTVITVATTHRASPPSTASDIPLRRGLPRAAGADPWPPEGFAPSIELELRADEPPQNQARQNPESTLATVKAERALDAPAATEASSTVAIAGPTNPAAAVASPAKKRTTPEPKRYGPYTRRQWIGVTGLGALGLLLITAAVVGFTRWLLSLEPLQDFVQTYPGEYPLPAVAPLGFPAWVGWQHFFNAFLMVMIIRSGLTVRYQKRPPAMWSERGKKGRKISLTLWFHQFLDVLWLFNGAAFVTLLMATGQWMRIVPTSWDVFPNALTAALKYASLDWPTENGWVNYNSLQQIAYFITVFIAAPLAALSGARMSGAWPTNAKRLTKVYPVEWARAVHVPVMIYFVLFIFVHVTLVLATGALRNLNHMYGASDEVNWVGFWIFCASLAVIAGGWIAARPLVLARLARLFGTVSRS